MSTMVVPNELPVIYSIPVLIPGFFLKIAVENNSYLLNYLHNGNKEKSQSNYFIGIIPKTDYGKVNNVIGTVGVIQSIIKLDSNPEELFLLVQGICRFKLDVTVAEKPLKINKIVTIEDYKNLSGDENKIKKLRAEFEKVLNDYLLYNELMILNPFANAQIKNYFIETPLHQFVDYCIKHILNLSPADTYDVLRATNLNSLLKCVMTLLKRETIKASKHSTFEQTGLVLALPTRMVKTLIPKKRLSPELQKIHTIIKNSNMPKPVYDSIMVEFNKIQEMNPCISDYSILIQYLNYVVKLPWNISTKETLDLKKAKSVLELNHYGIHKVKRRIIEFIAGKILNPERQGPILCFVGPPGIGKTTIAKSIANALNRTFKRISLGGINTYAHIKGHRKTYVGAMPGSIIQAINQAQANNPIILLDEIDKMQNGSHGDPAAALLEVLDPEQNNSFVDSYVNLPFDLSQVMFISTANDAKDIPLTLLDRMETIFLDSYTLEEKVQISEKYLIPKIQKAHKLNEVQITITQPTIKSIIQNYTWESGVRELQRQFEAIYGFISVEIVENEDKKKENYIISPDYLKLILGHGIYDTKNTLLEECRDRVGIAIGLAWTSVGGRVMMVETSRLYSSNEDGSLILTGLVGQSIKESVEIALNWIQSFSNKNELDNNFCVHVHFGGSYKKDGPSAGITVACALISLIWNIPLVSMIAMTGELSLQGYVLSVGGVKEKLLAAYNSGIKTIIIPESNIKDVYSLSKDIREELNIIPVKHLKEVLEIVIPGGIEFLQNPLRSKI